MTTSEEEKSFNEVSASNNVAKKQFSPIINRGDIDCNENVLSDMEEFYLIEIEQQQNNEVLSKLQQKEEELRANIKKLMKNI